MPNARVLAAAGGLPSRRAALATLAGAGAVLSLPKAARAAVAPVSADAALIAQAAIVERLAIRADVAWTRASKASDACQIAEPQRPTIMVGFRNLKPAPDYDAAELRQQIADHVPNDCPLNVGWLEDRQARLARMETYEAECARLRRRFRVEAAQDIACRADDRCQDAAEILTDMRPATMAGVYAKARAARAVTSDDTLADNWMVALTASVVCDVLAIGSAP